MKSFEDIGKYWWFNIPGPKAVAEAIIEGIKSGKHVFLISFSDLPWRTVLRNEIALRCASTLIPEQVDAGDLDAPNKLISEFFIEKYGDHNTQMEFREIEEERGIKYLKKKGVIDNKLIWVKGMSEADYYKWDKFCRIHAIKNPSQGICILETTFNNMPQLPKHIKKIDIKRMISPFDTLSFCGIIVSSIESETNIAWKEYISNLTALLFTRDAEMALDYIQETDFREKGPIEALKDMCKNKDEIIGSKREEKDTHPFYLIRNNEMKELEHRVWIAQLKVAFPIIQERQYHYADSNRENLQETIKRAKEEGTQIRNSHGDIINDPYDIELGLMLHLEGQVFGSGHKPFKLTPNEKEEIRFLWDIRNKLAHMELCTPKDMGQLFKLKSFAGL